MKLNLKRGAVGMIALSMTTSALAMPYQGTDISGLTSKIKSGNVGQLLGDSKNKRVVYVQPGTKKFKGKFQVTNGIDSCQELHQQRILAYRMPTEEDVQSIIDGNQLYSPAFQANFGVVANRIEKSKKLVDAKMKVANYIQQYKEEYGNYVSTKSHLELAQNQYEADRADLTDLNTLYSTKIALASTPEEKAALRDDYKKELAIISKKLVISTKEKKSASRSYREALREWAPYKDQLKWLTDLEQNITADLIAMQDFVDESLKRSQRFIHELEKKVVGYAHTSYNLDVVDEINSLQKEMNDNNVSGYTLQPLRVFNVRLNPGVTKSITGAKDTDNSIDYKMITYRFPNESKIQLGTRELFVDFPGVTVETEETGKNDLKFLMSDLDGSFGGSQAFEIPVTQGAVCGYAKSKLKHYEYSDSQGNTVSRTITTRDYNSPDSNQYVFVQNVALRYNFYEKSDPIEGRCSLNVDKVSSYHRNSGRKTSWSWFKKSTHTWDDTKKEFREKRGIDCTLTQSPAGANPAESREINKAFEKALYQDIFAMFLTSYAKSYTVTPIRPELLTSDSKFFSKLGSGVMNLCGANLYCQIGGIALSTMDELVGKRHTGSTSNRTTITGKLSKNYRLNTYKISEGFSNIEMRVCLDHSQCDE